MFVITINADDSLDFGPAEWGQKLASLTGLAGNKNPPQTPYTFGDRTLRNVSDPTLLDYQENGSGSVVNGVWSISASDVSLSAAKTEAKAVLAGNRYAAEVAGITVNGVAIDTDRDTQGTLTAARIMAKEDPGYSVKWKTQNGFVTLDAATLIALADAVLNHVQLCFDNEANISDSIDAAADLTALRLVNLNNDWPV